MPHPAGRSIHVRGREPALAVPTRPVHFRFGRNNDLLVPLMDDLYGDLLDDAPAGGSRAGNLQPQREERPSAEDIQWQNSCSSTKRRRGIDGEPGGGFHCPVCAEFVQCGSRAEHERGTLHRFNLFAEQQHNDRTTQAAAEPAAVQAKHAAAIAAASARNEAAHLAAQRESVGYRMLKLAGWKEGEGLGLRGDGGTVPIPTRLVTGRPGLERHLAAPARVTHKPRSVKVASRQADTPKAPGTRGERRAARRLAAVAAKQEKARMRDMLNVGSDSCEGNTGPLWRAGNT